MFQEDTTSSKQVDSYRQKPNIVENTKIDQLYLEVRDARDICAWNKWYFKANARQ